MDHGPARRAALLAALAVLLVRGLALTPGDLTVAGSVGLALYGLLTVGRPVLRRLLAPARD